jgi:hypothetical protein
MGPPMDEAGGSGFCSRHSVGCAHPVLGLSLSHGPAVVFWCCVPLPSVGFAGVLGSVHLQACSSSSLWTPGSHCPSACGRRTAWRVMSSSSNSSHSSSSNHSSSGSREAEVGAGVAGTRERSTQMTTASTMSTQDCGRKTTWEVSPCDASGGSSSAGQQCPSLCAPVQTPLLSLCHTLHWELCLLALLLPASEGCAALLLTLCAVASCLLHPGQKNVSCMSCTQRSSWTIPGRCTHSRGSCERQSWRR